MKESNEIKPTVRGYLICPVRSASTEDIKRIIKAEEFIKSRWPDLILFNPLTFEYNSYEEPYINYVNLLQMKRADIVFIYYKEKSTGVHFDLGMAYTLNKCVYRINFIKDDINNRKSYLDFLNNYSVILDIKE